MNRQTLNVTTTDLSLCLLTDWAMVNVQGADSSSYLQGQLTVDITKLACDQHQLAAHCDAKGKMWSNLRLFHLDDGYSYLLRREVRAQQITELKKYAIFSKVFIEADDSRQIVGVLGSQCTQHLTAFFCRLPDATAPLIQQGTSLLLWLATPQPRYLIIAEQAQLAPLLQHFSANLVDQQQWIAAEIAAGIPIIDTITSAKFIPQATNLQRLEGIDFKKGCYTGQEMVARAKYRGANKRALYWLAGPGAEAVPAGSALELQLGDKWRKTGTVLCSARVDNGQLWVQAVLNNDLEANARLRPIEQGTALLQPQALPYSLEES